MNRYIAFLKVFERNSFSDAARDLGYTQSAVSQMIKSLEAELGVTLLVRSRSGVTLTYEGRHLLLQVAANSTAQLDAVLDQIGEMQGVKSSESLIHLSTKLDRAV